MAKFNLVIPRPSGFLHASAGADIRDSLAWSLTALGHEAICSESAFARGATNIIFHSELIPAGASIPPDAILYNLEQPSHPRMAAMRHLARGHIVWDYSSANVRDWQDLGIDGRHLPVGWTPNLQRVPKSATQDIDVCFLGWLTPRRQKLLADLRAAGLNVYASDCCYGGARDQVLSRSKVALNINHDGRTLFNIVRVSFLLANGKAVVSEESSDQSDYAADFPDGKAMLWDFYDKLVETCLMTVKAPLRRSIIEQAGFDAIKKMDFTASVAAVLDGAQSIKPMPPVTSASAICSRYEHGLKSGDMVDFLPWLRAHARGQILEIGTRDGASTSAFLLGLDDAADPAGHLTSLDITDCSGLWQHPRWTFHQANSLTVSFPDASFDVILIDGNHDQAAYRGDLYNAFHWCRPGGLILTHDLTPERGHEFYAVGIREEWDKFLRVHPELKHEILPGKYGLGVMRKPE